jgi:hypothetical protein
MADPFYMVMLIENLGKNYSVWDKSASIVYLKPGRTDVFTEFHLTEEDLTEMRQTLEKQDKMEWKRTIQIRDKQDQVIATVEKVISIKKR